jgi:hypothetical protein
MPVTNPIPALIAISYTAGCQGAAAVTPRRVTVTYLAYFPEKYFTQQPRSRTPERGDDAMNGKAIQLSTARLVLDRFPDRSEEILRLYATIDDIRHVCDDLALAIETLQRFESRVDRDSTNEIRDFKEIIDKLDAELIQLIDRCH